MRPNLYKVFLLALTLLAACEQAGPPSPETAPSDVNTAVASTTQGGVTISKTTLPAGGTGFDFSANVLVNFDAYSNVAPEQVQEPLMSFSSIVGAGSFKSVAVGPYFAIEGEGSSGTIVYDRPAASTQFTYEKLGNCRNTSRIELFFGSELVDTLDVTSCFGGSFSRTVPHDRVVVSNVIGTNVEQMRIDNLSATFDFTLDDGQTETFDNVNPGRLTITENESNTDFDLTAIVCDDPSGDSQTSLADRKADIGVAAEETVACTFTNATPDVIPPTITLTTPTDGATYLLNQTVSASYTCEDEANGSGLASCEGTAANGAVIDTGTVGTKTFTVQATDKQGNETSTTVNYIVAYSFSGFFSPVDNLPTLNSAKAGQSIPLKWRLTDAAGNPITNLSRVQVTVQSLSCTPRLSATPDQLEEYASGALGLKNLGNGYYQFNWKTPKSYANSCKTLNLDLGEGISHTALFKFTR